MSAIASAHVRRHVAPYVNRTKSVLMFCIADTANDQGLASSYRQQDMATDAGFKRETVNRAIRVLCAPPPGAPGPFLVKEGRGRYRVLGVNHDQQTCGNDECAAEAEAKREGNGKISDKKRRQEAARARAYRARRKAAQG